MEVFSRAHHGALWMFEEEHHIAAAIVLGMLLSDLIWIVNSLWLGEGIRRGTVVTGGDMEGLVKIFHKV